MMIWSTCSRLNNNLSSSAMSVVSLIDITGYNILTGSPERDKILDGGREVDLQALDVYLRYNGAGACRVLALWRLMQAHIWSPKLEAKPQPN